MGRRMKVIVMGGLVLGRFAIWFESIFKKLTTYYIDVLRWRLNDRGRVRVFALVASFASLVPEPIGSVEYTRLK